MMNRRVPIIAGVLMVIFIGIALGSAALGRRNTKKAAAKGEEKDKILVAAGDIPPGQVITDAMVGVKEVPKAEAAKAPYTDAIKEKAALVGGTTLVAIAKEDVFTKGNTKPAPDAISQKVTPGYVAVTLPAPEKPSLYDLNFLQPEDRVDVFGVTFDERGGNTTSTPLALNARVLAVDKVFDKSREEQRRKAVQAQIDDMKAQKQKKLAQPGNPPGWEKSYDDQVTALQGQLDPKVENPSVTVEVTNKQAQALALWRSSAITTLKIALHRQPDANNVIFTESPLSPTNPEAAGGAGALASASPLAPGSPVLTISDVVPPSRRDPRQYVEATDAHRQVAQAARDEKVKVVQSELDVLRAQKTMENLRKYGQEQPPPRPTAPVIGPGPMATPPLPVPKVDTAEVEKLKRELAELKSGGPRRPAAPPRYSTQIEVYRGTQVSVVGS